jgi:hypothetical protein
MTESPYNVTRPITVKGREVVLRLPTPRAASGESQRRDYGIAATWEGRTVALFGVDGIPLWDHIAEVAAERISRDSPFGWPD